MAVAPDVGRDLDDVAVGRASRGSGRSRSWATGSRCGRGAACEGGTPASAFVSPQSAACVTHLTGEVRAVEGHARGAARLLVKLPVPQACSCIRPRCPPAAWATRRTRSSTGSPTPGSRGGRCCRSARRTSTARPTRRHSAFAAWRGLLAEPGRAGERGRGRGVPRARGVLDRRLGALRGRGAVEDQVRFDREWGALRAHAAERGVRLIGDIPIYVAPESADHVAHPELFVDDVVAGAPPDRFTDLGQLWGNPIYDWPAMQRRRLPLVDRALPPRVRARRPRAHRPLPRVRRVLGRARRRRRRARRDVAARPRAARRSTRRAASSATCRSSPRTSGSSPRRSTGCATRSSCPGWSCCSSATTRTTRRRRTASAGTSRTASSTPAPTTTTPCAAGTSRSRDGERAEVDADVDAFGVREDESWWSLIRLAYASPARLAMVQVQDVLGLGSEARMNMPGTEGGQWTWRLEPGALTAEHAARLRAATEAAGRLRGLESPRRRPAEPRRARVPRAIGSSRSPRAPRVGALRAPSCVRSCAWVGAQRSGSPSPRRLALPRPGRLARRAAMCSLRAAQRPDARQRLGPGARRWNAGSVAVAQRPIRSHGRVVVGVRRRIERGDPRPRRATSGRSRTRRSNASAVQPERR